MEIEDDPRSGRPASKITDENIELVWTIIDEDPHSTYDDIEAETSLSHGTIFRIIHEYLKKKKSHHAGDPWIDPWTEASSSQVLSWKFKEVL